MVETEQSDTLGTENCTERQKRALYMDKSLISIILFTIKYEPLLVRKKDKSEITPLNVTRTILNPTQQKYQRKSRIPKSEGTPMKQNPETNLKRIIVM